MSQTADIKAMLDWLATCPLATALDNEDVAFSIEYLGADADQVQFSLEGTPTATVIDQFFLGSRRAKNYVLASRMTYSQDNIQQAANSSFWDEFAEWVETQSSARNLPAAVRRQDGRKGRLPFPRLHHEPGRRQLPFSDPTSTPVLPEREITI